MPQLPETTDSVDARSHALLEEYTRSKYMPSKKTIADSGARQIFSEENALNPEDPPLCDPPLNDPRVDRWHILGVTVFVALLRRFHDMKPGPYTVDATLIEVAKKLCLCNNFVIGTHWQHSLAPDSYSEGEKLVASNIVKKTCPAADASPMLAQKRRARKVLGTIIRTHFPSENSSTFDGVFPISTIYRMRKYLNDSFESLPRADVDSY